MFSVQLQVDADFVIRGGSLGDVYKVAQLHFHWGKDSNQGSEHHKNFEAYPLEVGTMQASAAPQQQSVVCLTGCTWSSRIIQLYKSIERHSKAPNK